MSDGDNIFCLRAGLSSAALWLGNLIFSVCVPGRSTAHFSKLFHYTLLTFKPPWENFKKTHFCCFERSHFVPAEELCTNPMWLCLLFLHCIYLCKHACVFECIYMPFKFTRQPPPPPTPLHLHHVSRCCQVTVLCCGDGYMMMLWRLQFKTWFSFTALAFVKTINIFMNICNIGLLISLLFLPPFVISQNASLQLYETD